MKEREKREGGAEKRTYGPKKPEAATSVVK
jgi:hypothetical protein